MPYLFKNVFPDGHIEYDDVDRCYCQDKDNPDYTYCMGFVDRIIQKMFPITMPYIPESKPIKVICSYCPSDFINGRPNDSTAIWYCIKPDGKIVEINKFFELEDKDNSDWKEISKEEFEKRAAAEEEERIADYLDSIS
jgi:hypothetical protein